MQTMMVLQQVVGGVVLEAIRLTGRRLASASARRRDRAAVTLGWFETYQLVEGNVNLPDELDESRAAALTEALSRDDAHAVIHELLAVRLTDAPEAEVTRLAEMFAASLVGTGAADAPLADRIFAYLDEQICVMVGSLTGADGAALHRLRQEAQLARINATLRAIERHHAALRHGDPGAGADFLRRYRRHVVEHHGRIEPPDFERRRRVPIPDLYVTPTIRSVADPGHKSNMRNLAGLIDRTVLLGDPGGGKSTACHVLMHGYAAETSRHIPFLVTLREFAAESPARSVVGHIEGKLETFYQCKPPSGLLERLLLNGSALVLFDGLDELIDTTRRAEVTAVIERFCAEYPLTPVLVTSRVVGYEQARLDEEQFHEYQLAGFEDKQVSDYVRRWFVQESAITAEQATQWSEAFLRESQQVSDLRTNPLMLALMCILYRGEGTIPRNRPEVYEQCATLLFRKWDLRRRIEVELRARKFVEPALRHLAYWLFSEHGPDPSVEYRQLVARTTAYLLGRGFEDESDAKEAAIEFLEFCKGRAWVFSDVGTTASGEALYAFTHRTFMEYFAALHLAGICDTPEQLATKLAPRIARAEWDTVAQLAVQVKCQLTDRGAERFFAQLLNERRRRTPAGRGNIHDFLSRCLPIALPPPALIRQLTNQVLDHLLAAPEKNVTSFGSLLRDSTDCRDVVADEIRRRIDTLVSSEDEARRVRGLTLAADACGFLTAGEDYWEAFESDNVQRLKDELRRVVPDNDLIAFHLLWRGLIDVHEFFNGSRRRLAIAFCGIPVGFWETRYMPMVSLPFLDGYAGDLNIFFRQFCEFMIGLGEPPWVAGSVLRDNGPAVDLTSYSSVLEEVHLDGTEALGVMLIFLLNVESYDNVRKVPLEEMKGWLAPLRPYCARRLGKSDEPLPPLPSVPSRWQKVITDWAEGRVDFIDSSN